MRTFMKDETAYGAWLESLVLGAAAVIEHPEVQVRANAADGKRLAARWESILAAAPPNCALSLDEDAIETLGGVLVQSGDGRIRVDHTFDGRMDRLRPRIQQVILERLLPSGFDTGNLFSG
jgi:V/A-type H+-transporting ATPase subunit E